MNYNEKLCYLRKIKRGLFVSFIFSLDRIISNMSLIELFLIKKLIKAHKNKNFGIFYNELEKEVIEGIRLINEYKQSKL